MDTDSEMDAATVGAGTTTTSKDPVGTQLPPPLPLAESQLPYRKRAYRQLHGSGSHACLLFSLGILALYLQRLGMYNPDTESYRSGPCDIFSNPRHGPQKEMA
jgi:hypothetical protein